MSIKGVKVPYKLHDVLQAPVDDLVVSPPGDDAWGSRSGCGTWLRQTREANVWRRHDGCLQKQQRYVVAELA
jgi:hypothetical protein